MSSPVLLACGPPSYSFGSCAEPSGSGPASGNSQSPSGVRVCRYATARRQRQRGFDVRQSTRVADAVLLPCRPSGRLDVWTFGQSRRWDVEAVADTAPRVRTVAAPSVIAMLNARAPRLQSADEVTGALAGQGGVERRSPPWQPLSTQPRRSTWAWPAQPRSTGSQPPVSGPSAAQWRLVMLDRRSNRPAWPVMPASNGLGSRITDRRKPANSLPTGPRRPAY